MLLKYIEAWVCNSNKHYSFISRDINFDKKQNNIVLPKEYIDNDINKYIGYLYSLYYDELLDRKLYSSISNVKRAVKAGALDAYLSITYCSDINRSDIGYNNLRNTPKSLESVNRYCSAIRYYYIPKTGEISRYEIYGDIVLGDEIEREESYYDQFKLPINDLIFKESS